MTRSVNDGRRLASVAAAVLLAAATLQGPASAAFAEPLAAPAPALAGPAREKVPLVVDDTNAYVYVSVGGGRPVKVVIDTGASGLTIARDAIGPAGTITSEEHDVNYVNASLHGHIAKASVRLTGGSKQLVTPKIRMTAVPRAQLLSKWTSHGAVGSMGIAVEARPGAPRLSPLLQLPKPYSQGLAINYASHYLLVGRPEVHAGTVRVPLQRRAGTAPDGGPTYAKELDLCWRIGAKRSCLPTVLDTGGVDGIVSRSRMPGIPAQPSTQRVAPDQQLTISSRAGGVLVGYRTSQEASPAYRRDVDRMNSGRRVFEEAIVAWDLVAGELYVTR